MCCARTVKLHPLRAVMTEQTQTGPLSLSITRRVRYHSNVECMFEDGCDAQAEFECDVTEDGGYSETQFEIDAVRYYYAAEWRLVEGEWYCPRHARRLSEG